MKQWMWIGCFGLVLFLAGVRVGLAEESRQAGLTDALEQSLLSAFVHYVEAYMTDELGDLQLLADTKEVQSGEWGEMGPLLKNYARNGRAALVWFAHPDGSYYTSEKDKVAANLSDRTYFPALIGGKNILGVPIVGKTSGRKSLVVAVPIKRGGKIIGALGSSLYLEALSSTVTKVMHLPESMVFYALDSKGNTLLNSKLNRLFVDPKTVHSPSLSAAADTMMTQSGGIVTYTIDGARKQARFTHSSLLGWCFVLATTVENRPVTD